MTTKTELDPQVTGGCAPDGACAVVDHHAGARIGQPAMVLPGAMDALQAVGAAIAASGLPQRTIDLVNMRVSQIQGAFAFGFGLVHLDVWGSCPTNSVSGYRWFVTFIDCYPQMT